MSWDVPPTFVVGQVLTAAQQNILSGDLTYLHGVVAAELAYVEFSATVTSTATALATGTTVVSAGALTFDGATKIRIEVRIPLLSSSSGSVFANLSLADGGPGGTDLGLIAQSAITVGYTATVTRYLTPTAGTHTYSAVVWTAATATASAQSGTGGVAGYIRIAIAS